MTDGMPYDMWTPYKDLQCLIERSVNRYTKSSFSELEVALRKHKQTFFNLLSNPPKNAKHREQIRQGTTEGITLPGLGHTVLSKDLVDESIILSDMYNLNEFAALELLCTAQQQVPQYPGLPRGLVAVLLYYDGRKALVSSLRDLFQARTGVSWCTEAPDEIVQFITSYTNDLVEGVNVLNKIIDLLENLDISKELEILSTNRALGPPKHYRQVLDLFEDVRLALATALFNWSAQSGLPRDTIVKLIEYLSKCKPTESRGGVDNVIVTLIMAALYGFDTSVLQRREDGEELVLKLPIMSEEGYAQTVFNALDTDWEWNELKSIVLFGFGLALAPLRQAPQNLQLNLMRISDEEGQLIDEKLADEAIKSRVFDFIHNVLLENDIVFRMEFFFRKVHGLFTDFIEFMHSKVTELRARADETARTVQLFSQQSLEPPPNLCHNFESLLLSVGKFYANDQLKLCLCLEYWSSMDQSLNYQKTSSRSVSLFKFIRLAGELLPPTLLAPYLKMLTGFSSCEQSARNTFNLLKQGPNLSGSMTLSWDHFFVSLARYYANLKQEQFPHGDTIYKSRKTIVPQEIAGLQAVLGIIRAVAANDEVARIALCEHPTWAPLQVLLGLLSCCIPLTLKADILLTLSALGKSKETAFQLWNNLEASQMITTIPTTNTYAVRGLETEIEQNESPNGTYPLTQAVLDFLYSLSTTLLPRKLGGGPRTPGLDPYVTFIINTLFLRFYNRNYKNETEKWDVGEKCLKLLHFFIHSYEINPSDFQASKDENSPPGFHVLLQMNTKSDTLALILRIIDDAVVHLDMYAPFPGKAKLETCALYCLSIIEKSLANQNLFFDALSKANCSTLLSGLNKLLLDVNPRSRKPDHVLNTTKFVTYNSWLPEHALLSVKILTSLAECPNISTQLLGIFTQNERVQNEIRHGFVECLENDQTIASELIDESTYEEIQIGLKEAIIHLLKLYLPQSAPNLAHYLLGFDISRDIRSTQLQQPGVLDFPCTCTKSLLTLLDNNLELMKSDGPIDISHEDLIERAYDLLYCLCQNIVTSEIILRFLRCCNDFLCRHASALPFTKFEQPQILNQMSSLLKCIAIELKVTAANSQMSQFTHLCKILLGVVQNTAQETIPLELTHFYSTNMNDFTTLSNDMLMNKKTSEQRNKLLICHLLKCLDVESKQFNPPKWDFFDSTMMAQLLHKCAIRNGTGPTLINVKKLNSVLKHELSLVQGSIATGQRQLILQEIESVLNFVVKVNSQKHKCAATVKFMESWGQVTEILFSVSPNFAMPLEIKRELILETMQCLLGKVVPVQAMHEVANISSSSVLVLMVNLRNCFAQKPASKAQTDSRYGSMSTAGETTQALQRQTFSSNDVQVYSPKSNTLSLRSILKNIVEWIIISGVASQKIRINLYASLLNFMYIVNGSNSKVDVIEDEYYVSRLDRSMARMTDSGDSADSNQSQMAVEVFQSFGDKLIDILCHDCIGGHDICKMLSLSCIDMLLDMDSLTSFIHFISNRGYLAHVIDSLFTSDNSLCRILESEPDSLRSLYVYESKMAMLGRVASSYIGAELLLEQKAVGVLSDMKVFDLHPDFQGNSTRNVMHYQPFVPSIEARYQQVLFPALNLCDVVLTTLGAQNHSANSQVVHFLLSHGDMIEIVLRAGTPYVNLGLLQELSALTGLVARTACLEFLNMNEAAVALELGAHLYRLQKLMLTLFPRFIINEQTLKKMFKPENASYDTTEENKALHVKIVLEIASNIALYCRNGITNHSVDHRFNGLLFSPSISEGLQRTETRGGTLEITPSLGIVVLQLRSSVEFYNREKSVLDGLLRQKSSLSNTSLNTSSKHQQEDIEKRIKSKQMELKHASFITEQCLFLLWSHLDYYMLTNIPPSVLHMNDYGLRQSPSTPAEARWKLTAQDVGILKKTLITFFTEIFCKQLISTSQSDNTSDKAFCEALLRRIKRLIQFVPVD